VQDRDGVQAQTQHHDALPLLDRSMLRLFP
jgi:hypothetical protein